MGTSTGGTGAAGAGYATLSAAFTAINAGTHTGVINVSILGDTTEPADPIDLLRSNIPSSYTSIVIKPSGNRTITGSGTTTNTSVIDLLGADNVMIDGDDPSTLGLQNLTITQPTSTNRIKACIKIASNSTTGTDGADNVTIKNCILIGSRSGSTSTQVNYGIVMTNGATLATGSYSSLNVVIENNNITRCWNAIHANGVSATYPNTGLQILNNTLGTPASGTFADVTTVGSRGILLTYTAVTSGGAIIRGNDIRVGVSATGYGQTIAGIEVGTVNYGFVIDKNNIHDIVQPSTAGWGAHGIYITGSGNNTLSTISNNFIRDVKMEVYQTSSTSNFIPAGIFFTAGATGVNIVNNTIVMGAQLGSGSNFSSFGVNASVAGVRIAKFLNNNIVNTHSSTWAFGLYCSANLNISGGTVNNNNYYAPNTGHVGYYNSANRTALSDWQIATSKDANSYSVNPSFVSATDLHLNTTGNSNFESTGAVVGTSGVSDDYDGQTRPGPTGSVNGGGTAPDIGADEFDGVPLILCTTPSAQPTAFTAGVITQTTVAGSFTIATGSPSGYLVVRSPGALSANPVDGTNYAAGATLGNGTVIQSGSTLSFAPTGLTSNTVYTITIFSFNGGSCSGGPLYLTTSPLTGTLTTCAATPTLPTATSITTTGATIGWTASAACGGAGTISYTVNVFTDPARTTHAPNSPYASTTSVSQVVTGLSAATTYYYRIVASNGSCNSGNLDGSFTTACANSSLTLNEGFNTSGTAVFPICWTQQTVVGTSNITFQTSSTNPTTTPQEGTRFVYWNSFNITSGNETRLVSPPITTTGTASVDVDFQWFHDNTAYTTAGYSDEGVFVEYSLDGTTWITVGSQITRLGETNGWNLKTVTLPAGAGNQATIYVGFRFRSKLGNNCALDAVSIKPSPTCADNTVAATTAIGSTTATINWTASASAPANGYEWEVRSSGNGGTGFTGLAASGVVAAGVLTENVTGLAANTAYTVWVRANCGAGGYSQWVSGGVFTTTQFPATIPYLDDFSSNNYSFVNGSQTNKWFYGAVTGNPANAIYVSSDASGTTNDYNVNATSVVHSYRDIAIPSGTTTSVFSFDWKANAEACCDYVRVWLVPTSFIPTAGTQITTGSGRIQVGGNLNAQTAWQTYSNAALDVSSFAGATMRLIFEWRNDGSLGSQNAAAIDNVSLDLPCAATVTSATATAICGSGSVTIVAAGSLGTTELRLYTTSTGGVSIDTEMSASGNLITPSISTTTIFYVAAFNGTCETSPRVAVTATINPTPNDITIQSTINGVDACNQNYVELSITGNSAVAVFEEGFETNPVTKFNLQASGSGEFYDEPYFTEGSSAISLVGAGDIDFSNGNTRITLANSIDLSQYASATLTFDHICASEATYDFGYVQYSLDGGTSWTSFPTTAYSGTGTLKNGVVSFDKSSYTDWNTQFTSSASSPGTAPATSLFKSETLNLNSFITNTNFRIRFRLAYDDFTDYYGWIIDNVKINVVPKITWSPNTGLYTDSALTTAYAGTPATVVYAMPIGSETYTAAVALGTCNKTDTEVVVNNTKRYVGANGGDWNIAASWFPVGIPTIDDCVRIAADKSVVVPATVTALANTLTLESNTALFSTVGDAVLKLNNALVNLGAGSNVTFANNSSLVQICKSSA